MNTVREVLEAKGPVIHSTTPDATVLQAVREMCCAHVGALLVTARTAPVGIVSERDVMTRVVLEQRDPATTRVNDIMTREVVCIDIDRPIQEAMALMSERGCRHLPAVVDGRVVGVVSIGDLVRSMSRDQEYELQELHEYIAGRYPG